MATHIEPMKKSSIEEIEQRFDQDVERFSDLENAQATTLDAKYNLELITDCISKIYPRRIKVLDIGCGAGNYPVRLLQKIKAADITLVDLSMPMLARARDRVHAEGKGEVNIIKGDFRTVHLPENEFDVIIATAVLHHLRDEKDWESAFSKLYSVLKPGGSLWVFDLVHQATDEIQHIIFDDRYGEYLTSLGGNDYREKVFDYIEKEDSPRSLSFQLNLLATTGFVNADILHKKLCFASYVAFKQRAH